MKKFILVLWYLFFTGVLQAGALRSPEEVIVSVFDGWRLQNKTYITRHSSSEDLSAFGRMISTFKVISYSIDWQKKYKNYVIAKTSVKTKSIEKFLKTYYIYWLIKKNDGKWIWEQGYALGKNASHRYVYQIHKNNQIFFW